MSKVNSTLINISAKKSLGKAHTSNILDLSNETKPSNVQVSTATTFGESLPNDVSTDTLFSIQSGSVEYIEFEINPILGSNYDEDSYPDSGGSEASANTYHAYSLSLPSNYEVSSSNPKVSTGFFVDNQEIHTSRGKLQLVPPLVSNAGSNKYNLSLYDQAGQRINTLDEIDWTIDYYSGIVFVQDPQTTKVPTTARGFLYVGKMADEVIEDISNGVGANITIKDEGSSVTTSVSSIDFVGSGVTVTNSGDDVTVNVSAIAYQRRNVTTTITSSVSDKILGINATGDLQIRLLPASNYSDGQYFTIKDEAGNADSNLIEILASNSDTIDGRTSIILESPYAAVNLYTNGINKFFIY